MPFPSDESDRRADDVLARRMMPVPFSSFTRSPVLPAHACPAHGLTAQIPDEDPPSPTRSSRDTVNTTARFLEGTGAGERPGPGAPRCSASKARSRALTRIVFTRDSIEWGHAATVGDLLTQVPGVYLWRGGFIGRPELVNYQGAGNASAEYYLDGVPYVAAGPDSLAVDPALFSISFLDRIEVERWPGQLRVYLFTRRHDRLAPRSRIAVARGDNNFARYEASLERRFLNGLGFSLAGDYLNSPTASGPEQHLLQHPGLGAGQLHPVAQVRRAVPADPLGARTATVRDQRAGVGTTRSGSGYKARRTDAQIRLSLASRGAAEGLGPRVDLLYNRSGWTGGGLDQQINQIGGYLWPTGRRPSPSWARPSTGPGGPRSTPGPAWAGTRWPVHRYQARRCTSGTSAAGTAITSTCAAGSRSIRGSPSRARLAWDKMVAAPAISPTPRRTCATSRAALGWRPGPARASRCPTPGRRRSRPFAYAEFLLVPAFAPVPETEWITASVRHRATPVDHRWRAGTAIRGTCRPRASHRPTRWPPATIRSKFLRQFPSGIFDLKLRLSVESWGRGTIGRDELGAPIVLKGATFFRSLIQIQLRRFTIYWDRGNLNASTLTFVPGFELPAYGTVFGVRWDFLN